MPTVQLDDSALHYAEHGQGAPLLLLHAGWGLAVNNFAYQESALADAFRMIVPDRRGYGGSTRVEKLEAGFHWQAAQDMFAVLDALCVDEALVWGHSDGAVIGAIMAITQPTRVRALVFEGGHLYKHKPLSQPTFEQLDHDPTSLPAAAQNRMAAYHGRDSWQQVVRNWAGAWLELGKQAGDLYNNRLHEIACPTLVIHGGQDEHTMPAEMEELTRRIPNANLRVFSDASHCVHDGRFTHVACTLLVRQFLSDIPHMPH